MSEWPPPAVRRFVKHLARFPAVFAINGQGEHGEVSLQPSLATPEQRTIAVAGTRRRAPPRKAQRNILPRHRQRALRASPRSMRLCCFIRRRVRAAKTRVSDRRMAKRALPSHVFLLLRTLASGACCLRVRRVVGALLYAALTCDVCTCLRRTDGESCCGPLWCQGIWSACKRVSETARVQTFSTCTAHVYTVCAAMHHIFLVHAWSEPPCRYVKHKDGRTSLWVARRSKTKSNWPSKLDHIVAGGQVPLAHTHTHTHTHTER